MKQRITGIVLSLLAGLVPLAAHAAAPGSYITSAGAPSKWDNSRSIFFNIDQGPLGKLSNARAARLVTAALDAWQGVETARLTFEESDPLDRNVTGANLDEFLSGLPTVVNPGIFDGDGTFAGVAVAFGAPFAQSVTPTGRIA